MSESMLGYIRTNARLHAKTNVEINASSQWKNIRQTTSQEFMSWQMRQNMSAYMAGQMLKHKWYVEIYDILCVVTLTWNVRFYVTILPVCMPELRHLRNRTLVKPNIYIAWWERKT
jgi:hypothetical protein